MLLDANKYTLWAKLPKAVFLQNPKRISLPKMITKVAKYL